VLLTVGEKRGKRWDGTLRGKIHLYLARLFHELVEIEIDGIKAMGKRDFLKHEEKGQHCTFCIFILFYT